MTQHTPLRAIVLAVSLLVAGSAFAVTTSKTEYKQAVSQATATFKTEKAACQPMAGNARDICMETAKGHERVAKAEAEYAYTGKAKDMESLNKAKAEATYGVSREKCDDKAGNDKDVCIKEAKAVRTKAMADLKATKEVSVARKDAVDTKREADYKVAAEKCDAMSGDAKTACMNTAKSQFGKM